MQSGRAIEILSALADGVDPYTGEIFNDNSPFQNPDTVRALMYALDELKKAETRKDQSRNLPNNSGSPWTEEEDNKLIQEFKAGEAINDISINHGRTRGAIQSRLNKLGLNLLFEVVGS